MGIEVIYNSLPEHIRNVVLDWEKKSKELSGTDAGLVYSECALAILQCFNAAPSVPVDMKIQLRREQPLMRLAGVKDTGDGAVMTLLDLAVYGVVKPLPNSNGPLRLNGKWYIPVDTPKMMNFFEKMWERAKDEPT